MSIDSNELFVSWDEIRDREAVLQGDLRELLGDLGETIKARDALGKEGGVEGFEDIPEGMLEGLDGSPEPDGSLVPRVVSAPDVLSEVGVDAAILAGQLKHFPDYSQLEYDKPFPDDFLPENLLVLKDINGNLINPASPEHMNKFISNLREAEVGTEFTKSFGIRLRDVSEVSVRLYPVLFDELKKLGLDPNLIKDSRNSEFRLSDVIASASSKSGDGRAKFMTVLEIAANPGLYERMRAFFVASLNYRLTQMAVIKNARGDATITNNLLVKMAYNSAKYAMSYAAETLRRDRMLKIAERKIQQSVTRFIESKVARAIGSDQKTLSLYGKTIRLKPGMDIAKQIDRIREGYKPWVGKQLDSLEKKGFSTVLAAAMAHKEGRASVTGADIDAAKKHITEMRKSPEKFDSLKSVLTRLSGSEDFANKTAKFLTEGTKRQGLMADLSQLGAKLSMHSNQRSKPSVADRTLGQAFAADAILRAGGRTPGITVIREAMQSYGFSVKVSIENGERIKAIRNGRTISLRRQDDLKAVNAQRQAMVSRMKMRDQVAGGEHPKPVKMNTPDRQAVLDGLIRLARQNHGPRAEIAPKQDAPIKPDDKDKTPKR